MRFVARLLAILALALIDPASAADHRIAGGTVQTAPVTLFDDGDTLTIEENGGLSIATGDAAVQVSADDFVIYNAGTISYLDYNVAIYVESALNGQIANAMTGRIESNGLGIFALSSTLDLFNAGTIMALDSAIGVSLANLTLVNNGEITGIDGIYANTSTVDIVNTGDITGTNYGIHLIATTASTLTNSGSIKGNEGIHQHDSELTATNTGTIYGSSTGFSVHDGSTLDLHNSGTIEGTSDYGLYIYDDLVTDESVARVVNTGTIIGGEAGIRVRDAELSLVNADLW